jgi:hypothetical protein
MKLRELIVMEDGEASVATTSADIATVAYPLFVRGKSNKEKRKNARAAVGQKYVPGPKGIGTGVFENVEEAVNWKAAGIGGIAGAGLGALAAGPLGATIGGWAGASIGSGIGTKNKNSTDQIEPVEATDELRQQALQVITKLKKVVPASYHSTQMFDERMKLAIKLTGIFKPLGKGFYKTNLGKAISHGTHNIIDDGDMSDPADLHRVMSAVDSMEYFLTKQDVEEAHVLNHDNVIYRLDRENPMSDTEVAVLGGAGRYSLKALRDKARREAAALAQDLSIEHGGAFRRSAENIKQLTNTINTIVAAYNELARLRRKGGRGSRGITDEDTNFIRECIRVVEQATQNYRLMEGLTQEPDPQGYAKDTLSNPKYAIVVNTPGDLDWYKIGTYWNNNKIDPHEFGQDDSDTVMVAQGEEEYKEMLAKVKQMGLTYKIIGGTNDQPEIHDKA